MNTKKKIKIECPFCHLSFNSYKSSYYTCSNCLVTYKNDDSKKITVKQIKLPRMYNTPIICDLEYEGKMEW
ncbi:MAG: hypothetical protein GQ540_03420 [Lutibacter sp.]|nr:hypothetical protein [Lutibacter sp.]